ncbi:MAG: YqgE/AlgH family protein [Moraxellaceae bacterium]|nr:YqgE/AlgH family protein [Moraxellaceae bacterium]
MNLNNLTHHFLIASPQMTDERFNRSLIYIFRHDKQGALGLVINHPLPDVSLKKLFEDLDIECKQQAIAHELALAGGPVHPEIGFILHTGQPTWASSFAISENVCITTSRDIIQSIATDGGVSKFQMCLGHSRWLKKQLLDEINRGDWFVCPADLHLLFDVPYDERWHLAGEKIGINLDYLSAEMGHA